jgi:hypothetical protein
LRGRLGLSWGGYSTITRKFARLPVGRLKMEILKRMSHIKAWGGCGKVRVVG